MTSDTVPVRKIPGILIVDDTIANLELLSGMLREQGYEPRPVPSGKLALAAARADPPDLILLDIRMPEMDGFEVCERLKADEALSDIPVILITALTETADKVMGFSKGAVDYVTKPFHLEEIEARIQTHLRLRSLQCQLSDQNENLERLVEERTRELANMYGRLRQLDRVKDDFLRMISHELRTPSNGVLGIGELILDMCPASEDITRFSELFHMSSLRLLNLIEDATMIADIENLALKSGAAISFSELLAEVRASLPDIQISVEGRAAQEPVSLTGDHTLLKKAMETMVLLATSFSVNTHAAIISGGVEPGFLRVHIDLDALSLSEKSAADFFEMESQVRSASTAESLGLAPVAAHKIISVLGGEMRLVKGEGNAGYLEAMLPVKSM